LAPRYPLDLPEDNHPREGSRPGPLKKDGWAIRFAAAAADVLLQAGDWRRRHLDLTRAILGLVMIGLGVMLGSAAALTDSYLHRGVESGIEPPYVVQFTDRGMATNVELRNLSGDEVELIATALDRANFQFVRQEFAWAEIEQARGQFDWAEYDLIVNTLQRHGLQVIAVIVDTPPWARAIGDSTFQNSRPRQPATIGTFAQELTSHYMESVPFVQVWDQPNIAENWGGRPVTAVEFAPVLEAAWTGARNGNASVRVLSPELAPVSDQPDGVTDLQFLEDLYAVGASSTFDIVGISLDGGEYSPDDRRVSESKTNFSRAILFRELMVRRDDAGTPVWATSFGWATSESVTAQEQAEFVERGMERGWSEWPWMGLMVHWSFLAPVGSIDSQYAIVSSEGTSTPLYQRLTSDELMAQSNMANTGFAPMDASAISYSGSWQDQHLEGRTFRTSRQVGASATITFRGTGLISFVRSGPDTGVFRIELDGKVVSGGGGESGEDWDLSIFSTTEDLPRTLVDDLNDETHTLTITLVGDGELTLGGFEITREAPFVWPIVLMAVGSLLGFFFGLRSLAYLLATRAGHLRREGQDGNINSGLPKLNNWRPERRVS
jgi:hypothetical protein